MAVLTRDALLAEIEAGALALDPFDPSAVGPASIDLTLGDEIRVLSPGPDPIPIREDADFRDYTHLARLDRPYVLAPGDTIHGITRERITLSPSLCGLLEGRSRFARLGLMIHVTSAFVQPGVSNRQVLEMSNVSGHPLEIHAGVRICQLVVLRAEGRAVYRGRFARQDSLQLRAVVQRVREARIRVGEEEVAQMGEGLLALVGVAREDGPEDAAALADKLVHLRVMADAEGRMNRSLLESGGTLGVVSQFTLLGDARKGRRPSWLEAAPPDQAEPLVSAVAEAARRAGVPVVTGRFRAQMEVALVNSGPVTVLLDSRRLF